MNNPPARYAAMTGRFRKASDRTGRPPSLTIIETHRDGRQRRLS